MENVKEEWEELVGATGEEAKQQIEEERSDLERVEVIPEGAPVTRDFRIDRVRIFVDAEGRVVRIPKVG